MSGDGFAAQRDFRKWLDSIRCTKPVTVDDTRALYAMIKQNVPPGVPCLSGCHPMRSHVREV